MFQAVTQTAVSNLDLPKIVLAVGALGTAAYGLVDVSKSLWGGISNRGLSDIKRVVSKVIPVPSQGADTTSALALPSVLATLRANWLNGMALPDQKAVAKALIKLNLTESSSEAMAAATGMDATMLAQVAKKLGSLQALTPAETDAYGRFDLAVSALLDQGYQRADQRYRNSAKLTAVFVSVALALLGALIVEPSDPPYALAFIAGLLATPLAPVAKDLSSAIQAGAKVAQSFRK
jgi:hypothetical protein